MEIIGNVFKIWPVETFVSKKTGNSGEKRKLTIKQQKYDEYTREPKGDANFVTIEFFGEKVKKLDNFKPGQFVIVYFDLNGSYSMNEQTGEEKCFTFISGQNIYEYRNKQQGQGVAAQPQPTAQPQQYQQQPQQRQYTKPEPQQQYQSNEFFDSLQPASEQGGTSPD